MPRRRGFTLLELMVVVTIVAILAAFAFNTYSEQVRKSRRTQAMQVLADLALREEKWRTNNAEYGDIDDVNGTTLVNSTNSPYYSITIDDLSASTYTLEAAPRSGSAQEGDKCGTFTFSQENGTLTKSASGGSTCL
jgi:type IV pilus assembly protein PilE